MCRILLLACGNPSLKEHPNVFVRSLLFFFNTLLSSGFCVGDNVRGVVLA
jgi:hypothetical protein